MQLIIWSMFWMQHTQKCKSTLKGTFCSHKSFHWSLWMANWQCWYCSPCCLQAESLHLLWFKPEWPLKTSVLVPKVTPLESARTFKGRDSWEFSAWLTMHPSLACTVKPVCLSFSLALWWIKWKSLVPQMPVLWWSHHHYSECWWQLSPGPKAPKVWNSINSFSW